MAFGNWEMQAGDPASFALSIAFVRNPHGDDDRATPEERESWGAFSVWVRGENLCAHIEQGQVLDSSHWYMLSFMEWIVENWDALLHEERLPLLNAGLSASEALSISRIPQLSLKEVDELAWMDAWSAWWQRHCVRSGREGGLFPNLYIRRYRDVLELSTGAEPLPGIPDDYVFLAPNRRYEADLAEVADALHTVVSSAARELRRRLPDSPRIAQLEADIAGLAEDDRRPVRMAWLAGLGDEMDRYLEVAAQVDAILAPVDPVIREQIVGSRRSTELFVSGSAYARLLYGAISPTTTPADVAVLAELIVSNYVPDASQWLARFDIPLDAAEISQLSPGGQGSRLGEQASELLAAGSAGWVDVHAVLKALDVQCAAIDLSDDAIRAVSVFGPTQPPHIYRNRKTVWGSSSEVERFTLAHELCHLLLDREYGDELAVATGPWAPVAIEQRANAFAAAFLMPTWLLRDALTQAEGQTDDPETIRAVSAALRVSRSSLVDRLYNLGELTFEDRLRLRSVWPPSK